MKTFYYLWASVCAALCSVALLAGCGGDGGGGGGGQQPTPATLRGRVLDGSSAANVANPPGFQADVWFFRQDGNTPVKVLGVTKGAQLPANQAPNQNGILTDNQGNYDVQVESPGVNAILVLKIAVTQGGAMKPQTRAVRIVNRAHEGESDVNVYLSSTVIQGRVVDKNNQPVSTDWWIMKEQGNDFVPYEVAGGRGFKPNVSNPPLFGGDSDVLGYYHIPIHTAGTRFKLVFNVDTSTDKYDQHDAVLGPINTGTLTIHNFTEPDKGSSPTFTNVFNRIIDPNLPNGCAKAGCHDGGGAFLPRNIDLRTKASAHAAWVNVDSIEVPTLKRVKPGDAENSYVYQKVHTKQMPPGAPLSDQLEQLLEDWINEGAQNN